LRVNERKDDESFSCVGSMDFNMFSPVILFLVPFSPRASSRYVFDDRGRYQIATLRRWLYNSPERIRTVWFRAKRTLGTSCGAMHTGGGDIQMALLLYGNARDVKMTVGYNASPIAGILPVVSATSQLR